MSKKPVKPPNILRADPLAAGQRSALMAKVRSTGNRSTELRVAAYLIRSGISGWRRHPIDVPGRPDFYFAQARIALFVDGCFWHGCAKCRRNTPQSRAQFWIDKIESNRKRDRKVAQLLRAQGIRTIRVWEHELRADGWLKRVLAVLEKATTSI